MPATHNTIKIILRYKELLLLWWKSGKYEGDWEKNRFSDQVIFEVINAFQGVKITQSQIYDSELWLQEPCFRKRSR